jgi:thiamine biosynthesis protein ThiS
MKLCVNGEERKLDMPLTTVGQVLDHFGVPWVRAAVELNENIVDPGSFDKTPVCDGDKIEIVSFVGGG